MSKKTHQSIYTNLLLLLTGLLPLYSIRFSAFSIPTNVFELVVGITLLIGICSEYVRISWYDTSRDFSKSQLIAICIFLLSACVAAALSHEVRVSLGILKGWIIIPMIVGFLVASASKHNPVMKNRILDSLICSGVVVAVIGILQVGTLPRIRSLYDVPNSLALFLVPIGIIALYRGVQLKHRIYFFSAAIIIVAIIATQSVGAILAILGTLIISMIFIPLRTSPSPSFVRRGIRAGVYKKVGVVLCLFILTIFIIFFLSGRVQYLVSPLINPHTTNSATVRLQLWNIGIRLIAEHPLLGIGLGQFEPAYQSELHQEFAAYNQLPPAIQQFRKAPQPEYVFRDPHNWIISFWLNLGILGLLSFIYINWISIRTSIQSKNTDQKAIALGLIAMLLYGLVDTIYWKNDLSALWWILILLLYY